MNNYIDNYYIDNENTLHCFIGNKEDITISNVYNDNMAQRIIKEENELKKGEKLCLKS